MAVPRWDADVVGGSEIFDDNIAKELYRLMGWSVTVLDRSVQEEIDDLPVDIRAKLLRIVSMIEQLGLEAMREPYVKHLHQSLWEMRMSGRDGIARALYVTATGKRVVIVRAFRKKSQKTPRGEIQLAMRRAKEVV